MCRIQSAPEYTDQCVPNSQVHKQAIRRGGPALRQKDLNHHGLADWSHRGEFEFFAPFSGSLCISSLRRHPFVGAFKAIRDGDPLYGVESVGLNSLRFIAPQHEGAF